MSLSSFVSVTARLISPSPASPSAGGRRSAHTAPRPRERRARASPQSLFTDFVSGNDLLWSPFTSVEWRVSCVLLGPATAARVERRRPRAVRSAPGLRAAAARRERQEDLDGGAPDGPLLAFALAPTCSHCKCWCSLLGWWCWRRAGSAIRLSSSSSSPSCATRSAWRARWSVAIATASTCRCCG